MDLVTGLFRFFYIVILIRMGLNILVSLKRRAMRREIEASDIAVEAVEKTVPVTITMVEDKICGMKLQKEKAYIVIRDNEEHYFCSWDCREKFIQQNQKND